MNATRTYHGPSARDLLDPIVAELEQRLERKVGTRYALALALQMQRLGCEAFDDVEPLELVVEMLELAPFEEAAR